MLFWPLDVVSAGRYVLQKRFWGWHGQWRCRWWWCRRRWWQWRRRVGGESCIVLPLLEKELPELQELLEQLEVVLELLKR